MAIVSFSQSCPVHLAHVVQVKVEGFGEATMRAVAVIVEMAEIHDMIHALREWTRHDGEDSFEMSFTADDGEEIAIFYAV